MGKVKTGCAVVLVLVAGLAGLAALGAALPGEAKPVAVAAPPPAKTADALDHENAVAAQREASPIAAAPVAPSPPAKPHLPTTVSSLRGWYEKLDVPFHSAPLLDGTPRLLGQSSDSMTTVDLIGTGDNLEAASITIALVRDRPEVLIRNTGVLMLFMRETGWPGGEKWATDAMLKKDPPPKVHGTVTYTMTNVLRDSGVFIVSADPVDAKPKAQ